MSAIRLAVLPSQSFGIFPFFPLPFIISLKLLFPRLFMEFLSFVKEIFFLRWNHGLAIIRSWIWIILHPKYLYHRRKNLVINCKLHNIYQHSIVMKYFIMGKKTYNKL